MDFVDLGVPSVAVIDVVHRHGGFRRREAAVDRRDRRNPPDRRARAPTARCRDLSATRRARPQPPVDRGPRRSWLAAPAAPRRLPGRTRRGRARTRDGRGPRRPRLGPLSLPSRRSARDAPSPRRAHARHDRPRRAEEKRSDHPPQHPRPQRHHPPPRHPRDQPGPHPARPRRPNPHPSSIEPSTKPESPASSLTLPSMSSSAVTHTTGERRH